MSPFWLDVIVQPGAKFEMGKMEDAGYDLYSTKDAILLPMTSVLLPVGIKTNFPPDWVGLVLDRSSTGVKGIMRQAGVFDSNWRGEWMVKLYNSSPTTLQIDSILKNPNAKACAQVVFVPRGKVPPRLVDMLPDSNRGESWNGSTDASNKSKAG